jgi:cation transport ATPase
LIHIHRHVSIDSIFSERAATLGYSADEFTHRLGVLFTISIVCWLIILAALVLLWRKNTLYFTIIISGALLYLAMHCFYIGYDYFRTDTSLFDKAALIVLFVMAGLHFLMLKKEQSGESLSFFGEDDE